MSYRLVIYKMIKKLKPAASPLDFYSLLMSFNGLGFANLVASHKALVSSIVEEGIAVTVTNLILKRRQSLGLPPLQFDTADTKKLAEATGLLKTLERLE